MTNIYLIRHAQCDYNIKDDESPQLTTKGFQDSKLVTRYLQDKDIQHVFSSPYQRAVDTLQDFATINNLTIQEIDDFRERKISATFIEDFESFAKAQWNDFNYKLHDGESLSEVQSRNIQAVESLLHQYPNRNIVIGTHGTALSTIINYYDNKFGYAEFQNIKKLMPYVVHMAFDGTTCNSIKMINIL